MRIRLAVGTMLAAALVFPAAFAQSGGRPYLGIGVRDIDSDSAKKFNMKEVNGAEVTAIAENSPAAKAGLKQGDVILEYNGQPVAGSEELLRMVRETPAGRQVHLGVWRNGAMQTVNVTIEMQARGGPMQLNGRGFSMGVDPEQMRQLQEQIGHLHMPDMDDMPGMPAMPGFPMMPSGSPMLGIMGEALGQEKQLAEYFGVQEGVLVKAVSRDSAAEKAGIKAGDVIVKVEDTSVSSSRDITAALRAARAKKTVTVVVMRNRKEMPITVTIETAAGPGLGSPVKAQLRSPRYV